MNRIQLLIINELIKSRELLTSEKIADHIGVSSKTIRRNINAIKDSLIRHGARLDIVPSKGITLDIINRDEFKKFIELESDISLIPTTPDERIEFILKKFLYRDDYIKLNDLAEELYISTSRLSSDIKEIKTLFEMYDLSFVNKPNYGLKVEGSEKNKRICISHLLFSELDFINNVKFNNENDNYYKILTKIIRPVLIEENIRMSDAALQSLTIHILIAIDRIQSNNIISVGEDAIGRIVEQLEYHSALKFKNKIVDVFDLVLPFSEVCYLAQHLSGKKHIEQENLDFYIKDTRNADYYVAIMLKNIFNETRTDFFNDKDLKLNLTLHMIPFLERVQNKISIKNPIINDVKNRYNFAYELSTIGLHAICNKLNTHVSEDEISYFALHFVLALERLKEEHDTFDVLIVSSVGKASSQLLSYQMQKKFHKQINSIRLIEKHMLDEINVANYDLIFTTIPLNKDFGIPIYSINNLLDNNDFQLIEECLSSISNKRSIKSILKKELFFSNIDAKTQIEALNEIIKKTSNTIALPNDFINHVIEREKFATTELSNYIAIPHPNKSVTKDTFVSIGILKKPILWNKKMIQIIFLFAVKYNDKGDLKNFYDSLIDFVNNENNHKNLIKNPTFENLINLFER